MSIEEKLAAAKAAAAKKDAEYQAKIKASRNLTRNKPTSNGGTEGGGKAPEGVTSFAVKAGSGAKMSVLKAGTDIGDPADAISAISKQGYEFVEAAKSAQGGKRQIVAALQLWDPATHTPLLSNEKGADAFDPRMIKALGCDFTLREVSCPIDEGGRPVSASLPMVPAPFGSFRVRDLPDASDAADGVTVGWNYREVDYCGTEVTARAGTKAHVDLDPDCGPEVEWFLRAHSISMSVDNASRFFDDVFVAEAMRIANVAMDETLERARLEQIYAAAFAAGQTFSHTGPFGSNLTAYEGVQRTLLQLQRRNRGNLTQMFNVVIDQELATALDIDDNATGFCCDKNNPLDGFNVTVTPDVRSGATAPAFEGVADTVVALDRDAFVSPVYFIPRTSFIATGPSITYGFDSILDLDVIRENRSLFFTEEHSSLILPCAPAYVEITHCPSGARSALVDGACDAGE